MSIVCEEYSVLLLRYLPAGVTYTIRWLGSCIVLSMRAIRYMCTFRPLIGLARCLQLVNQPSERFERVFCFLKLFFARHLPVRSTHRCHRQCH